MDLHNRWTSSSRSRRSLTIILVMLMAFTGLIMISPGSEGTVTPATPTSLVASGQRIHENSTAVPVFGFRATSDGGSDRLVQVNVTLVNQGSFALSDLRSISTNMTSSGIALYRDDGTSNDVLDRSDTPLTVSSFSISGTTVTLNISSETVPMTTSGSLHWFIVVRTSDTISQGDTFLVRLEALAIRFSDGTRTPLSRTDTLALQCFYISGKYVGGTATVPVGEQGVAGDTIAVQGLSLFSGRANLETVSSITIRLMPGSGFDPSVDLASMTTNISSGFKLYKDDGVSSADLFDPADDTRVIPSTVSLSPAGAYWEARMELFTTGGNSVPVPATSGGSYDLFVVISSSSQISHGDRFHTVVPSLGINLSGVDGNTVSVMHVSNRSRDIQADTMAPDLKSATLTIFSDSGHFYAPDTDLNGNDTVFYNSISGEGLGQRISTIFSGYTEDFPDRLMGEPAFSNRPIGPVDDTDSTSQSVTYRIDANGYVDNPLTYTLQDKVGHQTTWSVDYIKDNTPPVVTNVTIRDSSRYIYADQSTRNIYFRPIMVSTENFHVTGSALEPTDQSGLNKVTFSQEGSLASSPQDDLTPSEWNGSYGVSSLSQDWNSPIYVTVYDRVLNDQMITFSYHRVSTLPVVQIVQPTGNGANVSGICRVTAWVDSDSPINKMEFSWGSSNYESMTYTGSSGGWDIFVYDWDTYVAGEGATTIKVKVTDVISGVNYNTTWVNVNNYPLWGHFTKPSWNQALSGQVQLRARVSTYCSNAIFYVGPQLIGSWTGPSSGGYVWADLNTALFQDGNYILKAYLQGFGGRSTDISIPITIDNTVPYISGIRVVYPGDQQAAKVGDKVRLTATILDNTSGLLQTSAAANSIGGLINQTLFDDGAHSDGSRGDTFFSTEQIDVDAIWGFHVVRFVAMDRAGNSVERRIEVPVDTKPPLVEEAWVEYPGDQQAAKTGDDIRVMARISDNTASIYVTLILDNSGSMGDVVNGVPKIDQLKKAAKTFINSTRSIDYVSLWRFFEDGEPPHPGGRPGWPMNMLNFTQMNSTGKVKACTIIDSIQPFSGTPIWDTIGNATRYTIQEAASKPVVVAFTDGADDYFNEQPAKYEEGSAHFAPWHDWGSMRYVASHTGKYEDSGWHLENGSRVYNQTGRYWWVTSPINEWREGLLNIPIPVYTIGLGLEHHDPPNQPRRTTVPSNYVYDNLNATWSGESGTPEYNLWRVATTSAGGSYYYAPSATQLETIFRNIARSIYSTDNPAMINKARAYLPLDVTRQVLLFDDGLHKDGLAGDDLFGSDPVTVPTLPTDARIILIEVHDWADNIGLGETDLIIDNMLPLVQTPVRIHYPKNRSSVADDESFYMEIKAWDQGSRIFSVKADGTELGFFPPITFNNTGEGNDLDDGDMNYTSIDVIPNTGGAPSKYYFVELVIKDMAGNSIKALAQVLVVNDRYSPVVEMIDPVNGGALSRKDKVYAVVTDDGVIRTVRYSITTGVGDPPIELRAGLLEDQGADIYEAAVDVSELPDGQYILEVYAEDTADRRGSSGLLDIKIDNNAPTLTVLTPKNNSAIKGLVAFYAEVKDAFATSFDTTISVDGGAKMPLSDGLETADFTGGRHQVEVSVRDPAGLTDTVVLTLYFDNALPDVRQISPGYGIMQDGTITVIASVSDGAGLEVVEAMLYDWGERTGPYPPDGNETPFASFALKGPSQQIVVDGQFTGVIDTQGILDGRYLLAIVARDRSGEVGASYSYLPIDNNAPDLTVVSPIKGAAITGMFTPEVEVRDPFLTRAYFTFNGEDRPIGATLDLNSVPDGRYIMRFVAIDTSLRSTIVDVEVFVDRTPPQIQLLSPADNSSHKGVLRVLASIRETSGLRYAFLEMDGYSVAFGEPIGDGGLYSFMLNLTSFNRSVHNIKVRVENMAGLVGYSVSRRVYNEYLDTDGDGVHDQYDDDPLDPRVHGDIDGDGFGSFYDDDDDGDGILDIYEPQGESFDPSGVSKGVTFAKDPTEWLDTDGDLIGDNSDPDIDGDGIANHLDAFPLDRLEWWDNDLDGIGDNTDPDIDGDGVPNEKDDLKFDPSEWKDTDGDGVGNNKDTDDDGDGVPDSKDDYPLDRNRQYNWWPLLFIALVALVCVAVMFTGMVFRDTIEGSVLSFIDKQKKMWNERQTGKAPAGPKPPRNEEPQAKKEEARAKAPEIDLKKNRHFKDSEVYEEQKGGYKVKWG
ncbi:MAG: hypothetical protein JXA22_01255 [Candidatus Thermoplasmatota archaeon]|nr:hypothetical protein [Candidatus Thermoplasmatota archaeon]